MDTKPVENKENMGTAPGKKTAGRIKKLIAIIAFFAVTFLCVSAVYRVLSWKDTTGDYISSVKQLEATDKDLIDVAFVGSSHCYCGIGPNFLWEQKGISGFDMAISGMDKDSAYYNLRNLLKTQSPKVVFVDMFGLTFDEHAVDGNIYRNMLSLPFSADSVRLVMDYAEKDKWADYIARFPIIHTRYRELKKYDFYPFRPNNYIRGESLTYGAAPVPYPEYAGGEIVPGELSEKNMLWLERLYELSEKEGFELVFMVLPFTSKAEDQRLMDAAAVYASERGIRMLDFNRMRDEIGFDYATDFVDYTHLNMSGAEKLSTYLADYLDENFDLPDHRGDPKYRQWEEDVKYNRILDYEFRINNTWELNDIVDLIKPGNVTLAIISLEGDFTGADTDYYAALSKLGMEREDYEKGGKWIYENGKLEKVYENVLGAEPYIRELSETDTLQIRYEGDYNFPDNITINREYYHNHGAYLGITIYNTALDRVICMRNY